MFQYLPAGTFYYSHCQMPSLSSLIFLQATVSAILITFYVFSISLLHVCPRAKCHGHKKNTMSIFHEVWH